MTTGLRRPAAYQRLSLYRDQLMGIAMLWVMFFHAYQLSPGAPFLALLQKVGYTGVDIFVLLSAMGLYVSLTKTAAPPLWTKLAVSTSAA